MPHRPTIGRPTIRPPDPENPPNPARAWYGCNQRALQIGCQQRVIGVQARAGFAIFCEIQTTIGENAIIKGDVTAGEVKVYGKVEGKITSERCELKDKSKINGDIKSKVFSMEEGAQLSGRTDIGG